MSKRALVLSAGGMFGAYQAGVWDGLHRFFQPDLVIGASVGSLNGYLIACGCSADELIARWMAPGVRRILDIGVLRTIIQDICKSTPRCDYALVATKTRSCRPHVFHGPEVTWKHIAASCGFHRIDGVSYLDGGIIDPLPLWAALELGATEIVTVDLLKQRPLPIRAVVGALRAYSGYKRPTADGVRLIDISPSQRLGDVPASIYWTRDNAQRWIDLGRKDALAVKHEFTFSL